MAPLDTCVWILDTESEIGNRHLHESVGRDADAMASRAAIMSVSRLIPRHMTMFPGGGSLALAGQPPSLASFVM